MSWRNAKAMMAVRAATAALLLALPLSSATAQGDASSIYMVRGADRDAQLVAKARQEGTLDRKSTRLNSSHT